MNLETQPLSCDRTDFILLLKRGKTNVCQVDSGSIIMPLDMQKRMKAQAELAYYTERLIQIRANMEEQGYNRYEYDFIVKKREELLQQLNS